MNKCSKYHKSGINQLQFPNCPLIYTGQTRRHFQIRYKEHTAVYKNNHNSSAYAQHLINKAQSICCLEDIMDMIFTTHKGRHLDTV